MITDTLKIKKIFGLPLLLLIGGFSHTNPINANKNQAMGSFICNSTASWFWNHRVITPNSDRYASSDARNKFRNSKGNIGYTCNNNYKYLSTYNLDQNALNSDFNRYHSSTRVDRYHYSWENLYNVSGTCTEVAAADIVLSHETDIGYTWHRSSSYDEAYFLFYNAVTYAVSSQAMAKENSNSYYGTYGDRSDDVLTNTLQEMYDKYGGKYNIVEESFLSYSSAYNKCKDKINQNKACLLSLYWHSVVCKGYEEYEFNWTEREDVYFMWWKIGTREVRKSQTYRYLAVDLGWGRYKGTSANTRCRLDTCAWISEEDLYNCVIASLR